MLSLVLYSGLFKASWDCRRQSRGPQVLIPKKIYTITTGMDRYGGLAQRQEHTGVTEQLKAQRMATWGYKWSASLE